jgi:hypothetical protein
MASPILKRPESDRRASQAGPRSGLAPFATFVEPEETLVVDARGGVTPAQRVGQRLLALLGAGHPGLFLQARGLPRGIRRMSG